jgi:hypothetical protein
MKIRQYIAFTLGLSTALFLINGLKAQTTDIPRVTATLTIVPPHSPYYSDYSGINASKVLLILQNPSGTAQSIKLLATLKGDNGITISTKPNYSPLSPIILNPYETKQLNGLALKDIFDLNSMDISGIDKNKIITTSRLPEGNYTLCLQVSDYNGRGTAIPGGSSPITAGPGCASLIISYPDAPILINPLNLANLNPTTPQSVIFNWINAGSVPAGLQYQFQLAEMPTLVKADPNQILNAASFPLVNRTLSTTSYVLSPADPPLKANTTYAWRVKAVDPLGNTLFKNDGFSAASTFSYGKIQDAPLLISPTNELQLKSSGNTTLAFIWGKINDLAAINYTLQLVEVPNGTSNLSNLFVNGKYLINKALSQNQYLPSSSDFIPTDGEKYAWRVRASANDGSLKFNNDGWSNISTFEYTSTIKTEALAKAPVITSPKTNSAYQQLANDKQPNISLSWDAVKEVSYPLTYEVKIISVPKGISVDGAINANLAIFSKKSSSTSLTINPNTDLAVSNTTPGKLMDGATYVALVTASPTDTAWYYAQQKKLQNEGKPLLQRIENNGQSQPVAFTYTDNPKVIVNTPISASISGRLFYRYKDVGEKPKETGLGFPEVYDNNKFPNVSGANRFPLISPSGYQQRPLKNVTINLLYVIYQSKTKNATKFTDIELVEQTSLSLNGQTLPANLTIATTKAKTDGSYALTFDATYKFGYLGSQYGFSYFGAVKLIINESGYYTCPDLIAFPKIGQTITIPDDIVFAKTYHLQVTVTAAKNVTGQTINAGAGIPNYPVQIMEIGKTADNELKIGAGISQIVPGLPIYDNPPTLPVEANADSYNDQTLQNKTGSGAIIDMAKTNANGIASFKNLLLAHSHSAMAVSDPFDGKLVYQNGEASLYTTNPFAYSGPVEFNTDFETETRKRNIELQPKKPEIYLRAITVQNGIPKGVPGTSVLIANYNKSTKQIIKSSLYETDENGYFKLTGLDENSVWRIMLIKNGFAPKYVTEENQLQTIQLGERFPATVEQIMIGAGKIEGFVVNEKNEAVSCNIRVADGPYIKTDSKGKFTINNAPSEVQSVEVVPTVDNYFAETIIATIKADGTTKLSNVLNNTEGKIVLKEKLHRVQFKVVDESGKAISNAMVNVGQSKINYLTKSTGLTDEIALASPDDEFKVTVSANGYVKYDDYKIIPLSRTALLAPPIILKTGQTITGTVVDAKTKKPIKSARVYTISGINADGEVQNETYTDANGNYTLTGVESNIGSIAITTGNNSIQPLKVSGLTTTVAMIGNRPVKIYAAKSGTEAYIRQEQSSTGTSTLGKSTANFELLALNAKAEIWGIPIEVNNITPFTAGYFITGNFINMPGNNTFKTKAAIAKLPFNGLAIKFIAGTNGNTIEPVIDKVPLELTALKITAFGTYDCEVIGSDVAKTIQKLNIEKNGGSGVLKGYITSELSSFNFSYDYSGKFLLGTTSGPPIYLLTTLLPVFYANAATQPAASYNLQALYGKSDFNLHKFQAKLTSGTFDKTAFYLNANVTLQIPLVSSTTMPAGQIKVTSNDITWNQYSGDVKLPLEKWTIKGKGLNYDINQGGFKVTDGTLVTDLPQIALNNVMFMPQSIDLGENSLSGKEALTLAGVAPLNLNSNTKLTLNYDDAAPFDQKPHYRLNLSNPDPDKVAATVNNLPGIGNASVDIKMFSAYSDAKHTTMILNEKKLTYHNVVSQTLSGIDIGDGFFTLIGNTDINIPGANNSITGRFKFVKENGAVVLAIDKLPIEVEMAGKVRFEADKFTLSPNSLTAEGKVLIYKNSVSDAIPGLKGRLNKTISNVWTSVIEMKFLDNQEIMMGSKSLSIVSGSTEVANNSWKNLKFTGRPKNYTSPTQGGGTKNLLIAGNDLIDFEIKGGIETDKSSSRKLQLSDINTPFGDLSIAFDFENKIFQGSLAFTELNWVMGPVTLNSGTVDLQMDGQGFILVGAITNANVSALPSSFGSLQSGMAIGYYNGDLPSYMRNKLLNVTLYNELPASVTSNLKGFYINVMKALGKNDFPQLPGPSLNSIPLVGVFVPTFDFSAGMDMYAYLNVSNGSEIGIGGKAFAQASCYYDLQLCTIGLSGGANGAFDMKFGNNGLSGSLLFGINGKIVYCVGSLGVGLDLKMIKDNSGFTFKPSLR